MQRSDGCRKGDGNRRWQAGGTGRDQFYDTVNRINQRDKTAEDESFSAVFWALNCDIVTEEISVKMEEYLNDIREIKEKL